MSFTNKDLLWKSDYSIGDKELDITRKKLFDIAKQALQMEKMQDEEELVHTIKTIIDELGFYVSTHFVLEQKYLKTIQYSRITQHTLMHKETITHLNEFISSLNTLGIEEAKEQLLVLIKKDFIDHIVQEDSKILQWQNSLDSVKKTFQWQDCFEMGEEKIDEENKKLFIMAQEAFHQASDEQIDKKIRLVIKYIYHYIKEHYPYEEAIMNESDYPALAKHLLMHRKIINQINHYVESIPTIKDMHEVEKGLATLIENTLIFHMMDEDEHLRQWYEENVRIWK